MPCYLVTVRVDTEFLIEADHEDDARSHALLLTLNGVPYHQHRALRPTAVLAKNTWVLSALEPMARPALAAVPPSSTEGGDPT